MSPQFMEEECAQVRRVALKVSGFWVDDPELWFAQLKRQFMLCNITQDETKYAYVLSQIETRDAQEIRDLITAARDQQIR